MATLYTWNGNSNAQAVQATAALAKQNLSVKSVNPGEAISGFPSHAAAPCLSTANGQNLTQLASMLVEISGISNAETLEWISFAENVICPAASAWVFPTLGAMPNNKGAVAEGKKACLAALDYLNSSLADKTFLVGDRPSAADAAVVASLNLAFKQVLAEEYRKNIPHVIRWFQTCVNQPEFSSFGKTALCAKEAAFDAKTFGELNKKDNKKGGDNKKQQQPKKEKAAPKPKAEKPAPAADAGAGDAPAADKKKDPWAGLGGKYDMDAWKRCYSNNDTIPDAMNYFWEKMDKENYSIWFGKYKYGDEIPQPFMASNLIRGMFQRLDKMRKHSFGSVAVLGEAPNLEISGVWFWKGQDLAFELSDDWKVDYDTYDWKKLDVSSDADKKKIQEYFAWEGDFDGKKFQDAKVFK